MAFEEDSPPPTKAELIAAIADSRRHLDKLVQRLSAFELTGVRDAARWCVIDHITHLTAWEQSMVALAAGRPRHEGLGVSEEVYLAHDEEAINAAIQQAAAGQSLGEALAAYRQTQEATDAILERITDEDLLRPYSYFLPDEPGDDDGSPIVWRIVGNTCEHIDEHIAWIEAMFGKA